MKRIILLSVFLFILMPCLQAQDRITISGHVTDSLSGEMLAGVTVYETKIRQGVTSNAYGFYSITVPAGKYEIRYSYIGYRNLVISGFASRSQTVDVALQGADRMLGEVVITDQRTNENVRAPEMSIVKLDVKSISRVPALLGEVDLIKVLQLLPGVQSTSEGSTGFSVRGGNSDQNLIILDEAIVHNASHLLGFFSVFNNDAVKDVTLYKGDIPAAYGGRLSSLLDVRMKDGNIHKFGLSASIGTVSSKILLEGPVIKEKTTFLAAARRTYADLFLPFARDEDVRENRLYFYDLNMKLSHVVNSNNRIYFSGYSGRDTFKNQFALFGFGNLTATLRWNHLFSGKLFSNMSLLFSGYNYELGTPEGDVTAFTWKSEMHNYSARFDLTHYIAANHTLKYGATSTWHTFYPGSARGNGSGSVITDFILPSVQALEHSLYISDEYSVSARLSVKYGLRLALFQNIGPGTFYTYDADYNPVDSTVYGAGDIFNSYANPEPRIALTFLINDRSSLKGSYSHNAQYLTLAQNSTAGTPLDIWFPASPNIRPQVCDQVSAGYFRNFNSNMFETSVEVYYKDFDRVIDFRDHARLLLNEYLEGEIRTGTGYSYGIETLVRKNSGRLTGWLSYTYSRSFRQIPEINGGKKYNAPYDKPHSVNLVMNYDFTKRITASATWIYATGIPVTFPTGRAVYANAIIPIYSDRNAYRFEDYHRLDLSLSLAGKDKPGKKWKGEWNLSVYNVYNRHNTWSINFVADDSDRNVTYAEKSYLFSVIPSLSYSIKF